MTRVRSRSVSEPNPYYVELHDAFPGLEAAQSAWMSQIDSLTALDRKTHELIRLVCTVILRNPLGIERHARFAAEIGATWDEVLGAMMLTTVGFGVLPAVEAIPAARKGFESAEPPQDDE